MEQIQKFDVMIVGAGPAGISAWLHLQKNAPELAEQTVVIDKAIFPRHKLCGGAVWPWSEAVVKRLDIEFAIPSLFLSDVEFRFRDERWVFQSQNPFRMVQRADFDLALVTSAKHRGMVFHENETFITAKREKNGLVVLTSRCRYRVKVLIGADGSLSRVRRSILRPQPSCLAPTIQLTVPADPKFDTEFSDKKMLIDFSPVDEGLQGYAWHFPCLQNGGLFMNHGIGDFRFLPDRPRANMKRIFRRELHARHIDKDHGAWSSHPIRWYSDEVPISCPNVILVGDAAGIDPAIGGGIHMALSVGEIAAKAMVESFQKQDFSFRNYKQTFMSDPLGQDIRDFTLLAGKMYSGMENPLSKVRDFFTDRLIRNKLRTLILRQKASGKTDRSAPEC